MVRILVLMTLLACAASPAWAMELRDGHRIELGLELGYVDASGYPSWTEGSVGKLRDNESGARLSRAYLDFTGKLFFSTGSDEWEGTDDYLGTTMFWSHYDAKSSLDYTKKAGFTILSDDIITRDDETHYWVFAQK